MNIDELKDFLLCCLGLNYAILLIWFGAFVFAHDALHRLHARWFRLLSIEAFDTINYAGVAIYKIGIMLLVLVPWLALQLAF